MAKIGFYAPLKSPDHPKPSGDRRIAQLLMQALQSAGHEVALMSALRSFEGQGDAEAQARIEALAQQEVERIIAHGPQIDLWFTYHLYHKAPDHLGPLISRVLGMPYVIAEASFAPKQAQGPWHRGWAQSRAAIEQADLILALNPKDMPEIARLKNTPEALKCLPPFVDRTQFFPEPKDTARAQWAARCGAAMDVPWLVSVGMLRQGDKWRSYQQAVQALRQQLEHPWVWWVVGDGPMRKALQQLVAPFAGRVQCLGQCDTPQLRTLLSACDWMLWPAENEALGMALLEAQACGLPVLAGFTEGVQSVCAPEATEVVARGEAFDRAVGRWLAQPHTVQQRAQRARGQVRDVQSAGQTLETLLAPLLARRQT